MATITLKNVPESLRASLRRRAEANRRSLNQEALYCLERAVAAEEPATVEETRGAWLEQSKRTLARVWADPSEDVYNALRPE